MAHVWILIGAMVSKYLCLLLLVCFYLCLVYLKGLVYNVLYITCTANSPPVA